VHHAMLDRFAAGTTPVHRLDPAAKTVAMLAVVLATVLLNGRRPLWLLPVALGLAVYHGVSRTPVGYTLRHLGLISPLALVMVVLFPFFEPGRPVVEWPVGAWTVRVTAEGLGRAAVLLAKFLLCSWAALLLLATTRFQDLLGGLSRLRVPRALITQLAVLYRYLWVLVDEAMHMRRARAARDGGRGGPALGWRSRAGVLGVLFLRSLDRAERIYRAMVARGFEGTFRSPPRSTGRAADWLFATAVTAAALGLVLGERWLYG